MKKGLEVFRGIILAVAMVGFLGYWIFKSNFGYYFLGAAWLFFGLHVLLNIPSWPKSIYVKIISIIVGLFVSIYGFLGLLGFHDLTQKIWEKSYQWKVTESLVCLVIGILFLLAFISWLKKRKKKDENLGGQV